MISIAQTLKSEFKKAPGKERHSIGKYSIMKVSTELGSILLHIPVTAQGVR